MIARKRLTVTRNDGTVVIYQNVVSAEIKPSMIKVVTMAPGETQTVIMAIKGWKECEYG